MSLFLLKLPLKSHFYTKLSAWQNGRSPSISKIGFVLQSIVIAQVYSNMLTDYGQIEIMKTRMEGRRRRMLEHFCSCSWKVLTRSRSPPFRCGVKNPGVWIGIRWYNEVSQGTNLQFYEYNKHGVTTKNQVRVLPRKNLNTMKIYNECEIHHPL